MRDPSKTGQVPELTTLLLYITHRCNLKCQHCYLDPAFVRNGDGVGEEITAGEISDVIDQAILLGLRQLRIMGGEPFLRMDLMDVVRYADSKGLRVVIETNGTRVGALHGEMFSRLSRTDAWVSVSVDGVSAGTHDAIRGVAGSFARAIEGLEHLVGAGVVTQVTTTLFDSNESELEALVKMCASLGVSSFKLNAVNHAGRAKELPKMDLSRIFEVDSRL